MVQVLWVALRDQPACAQTTAFTEQRDPGAACCAAQLPHQAPSKTALMDKAKVPQVTPSSYTHLWRSERAIP